MHKRPELYVIREPEAAPASNVISIGALRSHAPSDAFRVAPTTAQRDHAWRELMRRLQKRQAPHKPIGTKP